MALRTPLLTPMGAPTEKLVRFMPAERSQNATSMAQFGSEPVQSGASHHAPHSEPVQSGASHHAPQTDTHHAAEPQTTNLVQQFIQQFQTGIDTNTRQQYVLFKATNQVVWFPPSGNDWQLVVEPNVEPYFVRAATRGTTSEHRVTLNSVYHDLDWQAWITPAPVQNTDLLALEDDQQPQRAQQQQQQQRPSLTDLVSGLPEQPSMDYMMAMMVALQEKMQAHSQAWG